MVKWKYPANIVLLGAEAWLWVGLAMPDASLFSALALGSPEYAFFIVIFGAAIISINWMWLFSFTPYGKFYRLKQDIRDLYILIGPNRQGELHGEQLDKLIKLALQLNRLGISFPKTDRASEWYSWLPVFAALADRRELEKAREVTGLKWE